MWLALFVLASVTLTPPPGAELLGGDAIPCPDGTIVTREVYDPDPADPNAAIILFKRGPQTIALLDTKQLTMRLMSGQTMTLDEIKHRWTSPCELPAGL